MITGVPMYSKSSNKALINSREHKSEKRSSDWIYYSYLFLALLFIFYRYTFTGDGYLAFFDDDFYYYIETAFQSLRHGYDTFNGIVATNGFHPLWYYLIKSLAFLSSIMGINEKAVFISVSTIHFSALFAVLIITKRITNLLLTKNKVYDKSYADYSSIAITLFLTTVYLLISKGGMEVILTVPLILHVIYQYLSDKPTRTLFITLIASLAVFSRLDSLLFILPLLSLMAYRKKFNVWWIAVLLIAVAVYMITNYLNHDVWMPVSGMAKQLRTSNFPVSYHIQGIFSIAGSQTVYGLGQALLLLLGIVILSLRFRSIEYRNLALLAYIFPLFMVGYYAFVSGWIFWPWYFYMFIPSTLITAYYILTFASKKITALLKIILPLLSFGLILLYIFTKSPNTFPMYNTNKHLAQWLEEKEGTIAMGDRAGMLAYMIDQPVVQMEGLVMDKDFLGMIGTKTVSEILSTYGVDYYIAGNPVRVNNGWAISEPFQHHRFVLVSRDTLSAEPVTRYSEDGWDMLVFKVGF
jgi:hypothetical protein